MKVNICGQIAVRRLRRGGNRQKTNHAFVLLEENMKLLQLHTCKRIGEEIVDTRHVRIHQNIRLSLTFFSLLSYITRKHRDAPSRDLKPSMQPLQRTQQRRRFRLLLLRQIESLPQFDALQFIRRTRFIRQHLCISNPQNPNRPEHEREHQVAIALSLVEPLPDLQKELEVLLSLIERENEASVAVERLEQAFPVLADPRVLRFHSPTSQTRSPLIRVLMKSIFISVISIDAFFRMRRSRAAARSRVSLQFHTLLESILEFFALFREKLAENRRFGVLFLVVLRFSLEIHGCVLSGRCGELGGKRVVRLGVEMHEERRLCGVGGLAVLRLELGALERELDGLHDARLLDVEGGVELGEGVLREVGRENGLVGEGAVVKRGGIEGMEGLGRGERSKEMNIGIKGKDRRWEVLRESDWGRTGMRGVE